MNRRSFLGMLAALPFIGKVIPKPQTISPVKPDPWIPMTVTPSEGGGEIFITSGNSGYVFKVDPRDEEWIRLDQWPDSVRAERIKAGLPVPAHSFLSGR